MRRLLALTVGLVLFAGACSGGGGGGAAGGGTGRYCDAVKGFQDLQSELESPDVSPDASPEEAFDAMRASFRELRGQIEDLGGVAPSSIRGDVNRLVDAALELIDIFLEIDDPTDLAGNSDALSRMSELQEEVADAQERVSEFTKTECGIDLDEGSTETDTDTDTGLPDDLGDDVPEDVQQQIDELQKQIEDGGGVPPGDGE